MQLSLEARQRIHERYERQSVSQRQPAEDFQVSLSTVKRILKRSKDDLGRRSGSGNPGKIHERERQCIAEYAQQYPDAFLREYADELQGIAWTWQAADSASIEAPLARESSGPNPTDRGKKRLKTTCSRRREGHPHLVTRQRSQPA